MIMMMMMIIIITSFYWVLSMCQTQYRASCVYIYTYKISFNSFWSPVMWSYYYLHLRVEKIEQQSISITWRETQLELTSSKEMCWLIELRRMGWSHVRDSFNHIWNQGLKWCLWGALSTSLSLSSTSLSVLTSFFVPTVGLPDEHVELQVDLIQHRWSYAWQ